MARYSAQLEGAAALANNTGFAWLMSVANTGFELTRVTLSVRAGTSAATDMQCVVGINRVTTAGTTPTTGPGINKMNQIFPAAQSLWISAFATPPTLSTDDAYRIPFNAKSTVSLPLSMFSTNATTSGLVFINRDNALQASQQYVITIEWSE